MELNWSTFVLEILNFLVLVWILKRFLYQPVLDAIAKRRAAIENQLAEAEQIKTEATELKQQYENRLADWERERQKSNDDLLHEFEANRLNQLKILQTELAEEEEKTRVSRSQQDKQAIREVEHRALQQAAEFASRLLSEAASPELENRLFELVLEGLRTLPADKVNELGNMWGERPGLIQVSSVFPLTDDKRNLLEETLTGATGLSLPVHYELNASLLAGFHITIGAWVLQLNLRDELYGFTEFAHAEH